MCSSSRYFGECTLFAPTLSSVQKSHFKMCTVLTVHIIQPTRKVRGDYPDGIYMPRTGCIGGGSYVHSNDNVLRTKESHRKKKTVKKKNYKEAIERK